MSAFVLDNTGDPGDAGASALLYWRSVSKSIGGSRYLHSWGSASVADGAERVSEIQVGDPGTLRNLLVSHAPGIIAFPIVYTVRVNGVDTALTATITDPAGSASDTTHTVAVVAGDVVSLSIASASSSGANILPLAVLEFAL